MAFIIILSEVLLALPAILGAFILNRKLYQCMKKLTHGKVLFIFSLAILALEVSLGTAIQYMAFWPRFSLSTFVYVGLVALGASRLYRIGKLVARELLG